MRLISSPFWLKAGPCPTKCDKKDLMHAIGLTFGGLTSFESTDEYCQLRVDLDIMKPLRQGLFVLTYSNYKMWIAFKYENLPSVCFRCGKMRHRTKDCQDFPQDEGELTEENLAYSNALRAESVLMGKEWYQFTGASKRSTPQYSYIGKQEEVSRNIDGGRKVSSKKVSVGDDQEGMRGGLLNLCMLWKAKLMGRIRG